MTKFSLNAFSSAGPMVDASVRDDDRREAHSGFSGIFLGVCIGLAIWLALALAFCLAR